MTVRIDENLKNWFTWWSKAYFGSTCRAIESILAAYKQSEHLTNTNEVYRRVTKQKIVIEKLTVERNLRPRRKLEYDACEVKECDRESVELVDYKGRLYHMCKAHVKEYEVLCR